MKKELVQVTDQTYYLTGSSKIGFYRQQNRDVYIIDTGYGNSMGSFLLNLLTEQQWNLKGIIQTHGHRDHSGGTAYLTRHTNCPVYATRIEGALMTYPFLFQTSQNGCFSSDTIKQLQPAAAPVDNVKNIDEISIEGLEFFRLPGHTFDMIGIRTDDGVSFLGDSLMDRHLFQKHAVTYLYDIKAQFDTLRYLSDLNDGIYIPSHTDPIAKLSPLVHLNQDIMEQIIDQILEFCKSPASFDQLLQHIFVHFSLFMNQLQYSIVGSTIRNYLAYLENCKEIIGYAENNRFYWKAI